ncbi:hypothetical protein ACFU44_33550 [Nocardia rhizosphaerihabitans]|uniref:hypothetical protein n=1 Tax=Nocardia rhizosphaerihabitans TaxID=1691570 RepID=UPI003670677E
MRTIGITHHISYPIGVGTSVALVDSLPRADQIGERPWMPYLVGKQRRTGSQVSEDAGAATTKLAA